MNYNTTVPTTKGLITLTEINLREIVPFIHWTFFFMAWRMSGKFEGIETVCDCEACKAGWLNQFAESDRAKATEALKLFRDAQAMLRRFLDEKPIRIHALVGLYDAHSSDDDIVFETNGKQVVIPTLRQQHPSTDGFCYSLADFLAPEHDYAGVFATTVQGVEEFAAVFEKEDDMYQSILVKTLSDRLAEATAEWLHYQVRKTYWGYASDETLNVEEMLKSNYQGIRPAVGYPSLPDQSIIFRLKELLPFEKIGIQLTENGAMYPNASVCGLYFAHPKSKYFMVGKIDQEQFHDYARRCGVEPSAIKKWLAANL